MFHFGLRLRVIVSLLLISFYRTVLASHLAIIDPPPTVQAYVRAGGSTEIPPYFSGTNCQASWGGNTNAWYLSTDNPYHYPMLAHAYIVEVKFDINGEVVSDTAYNDKTRWSEDGGGAFDSTHFADGVTAGLHVIVTDNLGNQGEAFSPYGKGVVYNFSGLFANNTLSWSATCISIANSQLSGMNYRTASSSTSNRDGIYALLPLYTVFYSDTHGDPGCFADCFWSSQTNPPGPPDSWLFSGTISSYVSIKAVAPQLPPYSFVFLDACRCSGTPEYADNSLAQAFNCDATDRCFFGWRDWTLDSADNANWTNRFFTFLSTGNTVIDALTKANLSGKEQAYPSGDALPQLFGDPYTKIHGVYGGVYNQWFRLQF